MQKEQGISVIRIPLKLSVSSFNTSYSFPFQVLMSTQYIKVSHGPHQYI